MIKIHFSVHTITGDSMEYIIIALQVMTLLFFLLSTFGVFDKRRNARAVTVMEKGKPDTRAMREAGLDFDELQALARKKGMFNLGDIDCAVLEADGSLSVQPKPLRRPLNPKDFNFAPEREGKTVPVVRDGLLLEENIARTGVNTGEIIRLLEQRGRRIENIAYATINEAGRVDVFEY